MAKEIVAWCDPHMGRGERMPGSPVRIALGDGVPREVDLCEACEKELIEPVRLLIQEAGQPIIDAPAPARVPGGKNPYANCPECGKPSSTRDTLSKHLNRMHSKSINDADVVRGLKAQGVVVPDVQQADGKPFSCPDCDRSFETPQGMGAHRNRVHGYKAGDDNE